MKIVSAENRGLPPDPYGSDARSEQWGNWGEQSENRELRGSEGAKERPSDFSWREHAQGNTRFAPPPPASYPPVSTPGSGRPINTPYAPGSSYSPYGNAGAPGYPHPPYPPGWPYPQPQYAPYSPYAPFPGYNMGPRPAPKRPVDSVAVTVVVFSSIAILFGLLLTGMTFLVAFAPQNLSPQSLFAGVVGLSSFSFAGIVGGGFGLYHSIRRLNYKGSITLKMPPFWIFLLLYIAVIGVAALLNSMHMAVTYPVLTVLLISLAAFFPAFTFVALGVRRLRLNGWQTTWRRFGLALISGATLSIFIASLAELGLQALLVQKMHISVTSLHCIDDPNGSGCQTSNVYVLLFLMVSAIAPLVEETVKPLGVAMLIRRLQGPREAFALGLAAGIGFNLIETVGYMSSGYGDWLTIALLRSGSGLLHGFGAGMVALGWYLLVHKEEPHHVRKAIGCWVYAVLQHATWNGSFGLALIPGPIGNFFNTASVDLGFVKLDAMEGVYFVEVMIMVVIFLIVTRRLRNSDRRRLENLRPGPGPEGQPGLNLS